MPPKKGKKKKKAPKIKMVGNELPSVVMTRLLKSYERACVASNTVPCGNIVRSLKAAIDEQQIVTKFIVEALPAANPADPIVTLDPFVQILRKERFTLITDLFVWEVPLNYTQMANLGLLLEKGFYPIKHLDLMNCLIEALAIQRLAISFNSCLALTKISLDYNDFGDEGCAGLCEAMQGNVTIISLSMCYCGLEVASGAMLGQLISGTAVRELYIDGNDLECEGAIELIKACAERAEVEYSEKQEAEQLKREQEEQAALEGKKSPVDDPSAGKADKKKKKKKGKKKKSKEPPPPPRVGPWLHKLHIADNAIDAMSKQGCFAPLICLRLFRTLITYSECLEELDLEDNLIGNLGGREILEALEDRKEADLPGVKMRTTHRMDTNTLNNIIKLGTGLKKKKKKGKKKKK